MLFENTKALIGNTPLVRLRGLERVLGAKAHIYGKLEGYNLTGSVKDRIALSMIEDALKQGSLTEGGTIIEPTSGNTGIGLAALAPLFGLKAVIVMPESMSIERRKMISIYGAELVLTPASEGMSGAVNQANRLKDELGNALVIGQFENEANWKKHYETTGVEIYKDLEGKVAALVSGIGTGGTITGTGRYLKEHVQGVKVYAVEPELSPLLSEGKSGAHPIQGIGANFIPQVLDQNVYDEVLTASGDEAISMVKTVAKEDGLFIGLSAGAALSVLKKIPLLGEVDKNIVVILPDLGNRYLSKDELFN